MGVRVRVPEVLRRYSAGEGEVPAEGRTVAEALESLFARHPGLRVRVLDGEGRLRPYLIVVRGDEPAALETPLRDGDLVGITAAAEGG